VHQQIRLSLGARSSKDGPGAMNAMPVEVDPIEVRGSLLQLLDLLDSEGFDIRLIAGSNIEGTGELILAVDDDRTYDCYALLEPRYRNVKVVEPKHGHAAKRRGGLAAAIRSMNLRQPIHELFLGEEHDGEIPFHISTVARSADGETNA
jgi:hypothetical protein